MKYKLLAVLLLLGILTACGTSEAGTATSQIGAEAMASGAEDQNETLTSVEMLYYLMLGENSMMARPNGTEAVERLGDDYVVLNLKNAEIYNAQGEKCTLSDLTRGCPVELEWSGEVMESYPAQISVVRLTALSDTADPSVPPEDEIPAVDGGAEWWVKEVPQDLPNITMSYSNTDYSVAVFLNGIGTWGYMDGEAAVESVSCGTSPLDWTYDDNNTCKRVGYDSVTFSCGTAPDSMTVEAYVDGGEEPESIPVNEDGSIALVDGAEVIYVISLVWDAGDYWGNGQYAVKIVTP